MVNVKKGDQRVTASDAVARYPQSYPQFLWIPSFSYGQTAHCPVTPRNYLRKRLHPSSFRFRYALPDFRHPVLAEAEARHRKVKDPRRRVLIRQNMGAAPPVSACRCDPQHEIVLSVHGFLSPNKEPRFEAGQRERRTGKNRVGVRAVPISPPASANRLESQGLGSGRVLIDIGARIAVHRLLAVAREEIQIALRLAVVAVGAIADARLTAHGLSTVHTRHGQIRAAPLKNLVDVSVADAGSLEDGGVGGDLLRRRSSCRWFRVKAF